VAHKNRVVERRQVQKSGERSRWYRLNVHMNVGVRVQRAEAETFTKSKGTHTHDSHQHKPAEDLATSSGDALAACASSAAHCAASCLANSSSVNSVASAVGGASVVVGAMEGESAILAPRLVVTVRAHDKEMEADELGRCVGKFLYL
jgi:predicted cobalt transporter CbtA